MVLVAIGALAACGTGADKAGGKAQQPAHVLTLVDPRSEVELQPFLRAVSDVSAGALLIKAQSAFERDSLQGEADAVRLVQSGRTDLGFVPSRVFNSFDVTSFDALAAPMEIDSMALQGAVLSSDIPAEMLAGLEPLGLVGIGILPGPMRLPAGITRPLLARADYVGARIGVSPSDLAERSLRALGAVPVETPFEGADISGFDGLEHQVSSIAGNQYDTNVRWITANVGLWPRPMVVVANRKIFAGLTDDQRRVLREAVRAAQTPTMAVQVSTQEAVAMCRRGKVETVSATPSELADLRQGFEPIYRALRKNTVTDDLLTRIDRLKAATGLDPSEIFDCARVVPPSAIPSTGLPHSDENPDPVRVDGNWTLSLTPDDLTAAGDDPQIQENWGQFRLSLNQGRFVTTQRNAAACTWAYGTYTSRGDSLELVFAAGGGVAPTHAVNKPGEAWAFRVSRYRDTMRWSAVDGAVSPPLFLYKPWVRKGDGPARRFVDTRCAPPAAAFPH